MNQSSQITFVCCVESGSLESQTVRMVRSLRQHGGRFAHAPIFAVTPRLGPPLSRATVRAFKAFGVTYLRRSFKTAYPWFRFLNKPLALMAAEEHARSEAMCFLDSDLLIVDEPDKLELLAGEDFLGFPVESKEMGTTGPGDPYEPLWVEFCRIVGVDIQSLPWVTTAETNQQVRFYFNGGIFVYRRSKTFASDYLDICIKLLDSRIGTAAKGYSEGIKEMSAVGFAVVRAGLNWRSLPYSHDYVMMSGTHKTWYKEELLRQAKIIHYHNSLWPSFYPVFIDCLQKTHPAAWEWIASLGPMSNQAPPLWRILSKLLQKQRFKAEQAYRKTCHLV